MSLDKLFGVLVVGGSLLALAGCSGDDDGDRRDPLTRQPDAAAATPDADPAAPDGAGALAPCFCNTQECCQRDESGVGTVQPGFECCWSTTC